MISTPASARARRCASLGATLALAAGLVPACATEPHSPASSPSAVVQSCRETDPRRLRHESFCLAKTGDETALPRLLEIAVATETRFNPREPRWFTDEASATDNAAIVAGKTSERTIFAMAMAPDPHVQAFAMATLVRFADFLRSGYGRGLREDQARLDQVRPRFSEACRRGLRPEIERLMLTSLRCLAESGDRSLLPVYVRIAGEHPSPAVRTAAVESFRQTITPDEPVDPALFHAVAAILERPIPRGDDARHEIELRERACAVFRARAEGGEPWVRRAAETAYAEIGRVQPGTGQAEICQEIALRAGPSAVVPPVVQPPRPWFGELLEGCSYSARLGMIPNVQLCMVSLPLPSGRRFVVDLRDVGTRRTIGKWDFPLPPGEYADLDHIEAFDLSPTVAIVLFHVMAGVPDRYTSGYASIHLLDTQRLTLAPAWRSPPCTARCDQHGLELRSEARGPAWKILYGDRYSGQVHPVAELFWDGAALRQVR